MVIESEQVRDYWKRSAVPFDALYSERAMNPVVRHVNRILRFGVYQRYMLLMEYLRDNQIRTLLDVGCGSGRYAMGAADAGVREYVGVDFSDEMIALARSATRDVASRMDRCEFRIADFMTLEGDQTYEVVSAMGVFDYIADATPALAKLALLATHSVLATFPGYSPYRAPLRWIRLRLRGCPVYFYSQRRIRLLSEVVGFRRYEVVKMKGLGSENFVIFSK